jgi:hypothetical protein
MAPYELITAADKPALLGISTLEWQARVLAVLDGQGYKVHAAQDHDDFINRFTQYQYQVTVIEEMFQCSSLADNRSLRFVQHLTMGLRRHSTVFLLGDSFQTLHPMQAFAQSVHAVIHSADFDNLESLLTKVVNDNELFLTAYRQVQDRLAQGKL